VRAVVRCSDLVEKQLQRCPDWRNRSVCASRASLSGKLPSGGADLPACVISHGASLPTDQLWQIRCPVLGNYDDAPHAFFNERSPAIARTQRRFPGSAPPRSSQLGSKMHG
jgi:hypothetical protein